MKINDMILIKNSKLRVGQTRIPRHTRGEVRCLNEKHPLPTTSTTTLFLQREIFVTSISYNESNYDIYLTLLYLKQLKM